MEAATVLEKHNNMEEVRVSLGASTEGNCGNFFYQKRTADKEAQENRGLLGVLMFLWRRNFLQVKCFKQSKIFNISVSLFRPFY